jgi:aerobic-type carbon monoxide dehydrogenase small subunit (CoxS/CutS family)
MKLNINGKVLDIDAQGDTPLLWALRDHMDVKEVKFGCGAGLCGACTVHIDGQPARSCQVPISAVTNNKITTINGLPAPLSKKIKDAWIAEEVPQCGYCQHGQMMSAAALLAKNKNPSDEQIAEAMSGNLCRCGTHQRIVAAIKRYLTA